MTVFRNEGQWDASNVEFQDGRILAYDKVHRTAAMQYIDYGLGVWNQRAFDVVPETGSCDLADSQQGDASQGSSRGSRSAERFYEIGSMSGLEETRKYLAG